MLLLAGTAIVEEAVLTGGNTALRLGLTTPCYEQPCHNLLPADDPPGRTAETSRSSTCCRRVDPAVEEPARHPRR